MGAVGLIARSEIRQRRGSLIVLVGLVALVTATVLAGSAGARRTSSALDRWQEATRASDIRAFALHPDFARRPELVDDLRADLEALDRVGSVVTVHVAYLDAGTTYDFSLMGSTDGGFYDQDRPMVLDGRLPAVDSLDEIAVTESAATELGVGVGDAVGGATFSPEMIAALVAQEPLGFDLDGPEQSFRVVGVVRTGGELSVQDRIGTPAGIVSPAYVAERVDEVGAAATMIGLQVDSDDASIDDVVAILRSHTGAYEAYAEWFDEEHRDLHSTHRTLAVGIAVFTIVAGLAGLLAAGQAMSRQIQLTVEADEVAWHLGLDGRRRTLAAALPSIGALLVGAALGTAGAVPLSALFPIGGARRVEVAAGVSVDSVAFVVVGLLVVVVLAAWSVLAAGSVVRRSAERLPARSNSRVIASASRLTTGASGFVGLRLLATRGRGRRAVPVRPAVVGGTVAVAGLVAISVFVVTTRDVLSDPERYGWGWTATPDLNSEDEYATAARVLEDERVDSGAVLACGPAEIDASLLYACALEVFKGSVSFTLTDGRPPTGPGEVALARITMREQGLDIGDTTELAGPTGTRVPVDVVGEIVMPPPQEPGRGAVVTMATLERVEAANDLVFAMSYPSVTDPDIFEAELETAGDIDFNPYSRPEEPETVLQLDAMRTMFLLLGGFLALVGTIGMLHFLTLAIRRRRSQFAVLRALGFRRAQVRQVVSVQAAAVTVAALIVGVPVGIVVGRSAWLGAVVDVGIVDAPTVPWSLLGAIVVTTLAGGLLLAVVPGIYAARRNPAEELRSE
jgi:hypothetical protein